MANLALKLLVNWLVANWKTALTAIGGTLLSKFGAAWLAAHGINPEDILRATVLMVGVFAKDATSLASLRGSESPTGDAAPYDASKG